MAANSSTTVPAAASAAADLDAGAVNVAPAHPRLLEVDGVAIPFDALAGVAWAIFMFFEMSLDRGARARGDRDRIGSLSADCVDRMWVLHATNGAEGTEDDRASRVALRALEAAGRLTMLSQDGSLQDRRRWLPLTPMVDFRLDPLQKAWIAYVYGEPSADNTIIF
eukprot:tig00020801_g13945.t1